MFRKIFCIFYLSLFPSWVAAFDLNVSASDANGAFETYTLQDLGVGDKADFERWEAICKQNDKLFAVGSATVKDNNWGTDWRLTVLPNNRVSIELRSKDQVLKGEELVDEIKLIFKAIHTCKYLETYRDTKPDELLSVSSINGAKDIRSLMEAANVLP